jgi:hypothetical protein
MNKRKTTEQFIQESIKIHGDKYDYSKVEYINTHKKVIIICKVNNHGEFLQTPSKHLQNRGCSKCGLISRIITSTKTKEQFIKDCIEVHGYLYDYSKIEYINTHSKVIIICKYHGEFLQTPSSHLNDQGCPKCGLISRIITRTKTKDQFIKDSIEIHGDLYDYSKVKYINNHSKVIIICKNDNHGEFLQEPSNHLNKNGCPKCCKNGYSQKAIKWLNLISITEKIYIQHAENSEEFKILDPLYNKVYKVDGYCKTTNTVYEYMGCIWHGCQKCFNENEISHPYSGLSNKEIYNKTMFRLKQIISLGYKVIIKWEHDDI